MEQTKAEDKKVCADLGKWDQFTFDSHLKIYHQSMRTTNFYLQKSYNSAQVGFWPQLVQDKWSFQDQ